MTSIDFKLTKEQQERFNLILSETKRIHPELLIDDISKERIKVLIAYSIINNNDFTNLKKNVNVIKENVNVFEEIKD